MLRRFLMLAAVAFGAPALAQTPVDVSDPSLTEKPKFQFDIGKTPDYPAQARFAGQSGETVLSLCVDADGKVTSSETAESSGHELLDDAAHDWIFTAPFTPAQAGDKPVAVCGYRFTYVWDLSESRVPVPIFEPYDTMAEEDRPKLLTRGATPDYPASARARGVAGMVEMTLCIDHRGRVVGLPEAPKGGDGALAAATLQIVATSKFSPGLKGGKPVRVCGVPFVHEWVLPQ